MLDTIEQDKKELYRDRAIRLLLAYTEEYREKTGIVPEQILAAIDLIALLLAENEARLLAGKQTGE